VLIRFGPSIHEVENSVVAPDARFLSSRRNARAQVGGGRLSHPGQVADDQPQTVDKKPRSNRSRGKCARSAQ
jgi:hypothetical protein